MNKRIIFNTLSTILLIGAVVLFFYFIGRFCASKKSQIICNEVNVSLLDSAVLDIISIEEIMAELNSQYPIEGKLLDSIDLNKVENILKARGEISDAQAFSDITGTVWIEATQRMPIARFENNRERYYCSDEGFLFPVNCNVDVPIITGFLPLSLGRDFKGYVDDISEKSWLETMIALSQFINSSNFFSRQIEQIFVERGGSLTMFTEDGTRIIFGDPSGFESKFRKLEAYYKCIVPAKTGNKYKEVNVSFHGEIVCK